MTMGGKKSLNSFPNFPPIYFLYPAVNLAFTSRQAGRQASLSGTNVDVAPWINWQVNGAVCVLPPQERVPTSVTL